MSDASNYLFPVMRDHKLDAQRELNRISSADATHEALRARIAQFQQGLKEDEEVGACFAFVGQAVQIRVRAIEYEDPTLIVLKGIDENGREVSCLQHLSQVSLLLVPIKAPPGPGAKVFRLTLVP